MFFTTSAEPLQMSSSSIRSSISSSIRRLAEMVLHFLSQQVPCISTEVERPRSTSRLFWGEVGLFRTLSLTQAAYPLESLPASLHERLVSLCCLCLPHLPFPAAHFL